MYGHIEQQQIEDFIWALHNSKKIIIEKDFINTANIDTTKNFFPIIISPIELNFFWGRVNLGGVSNDGKVYFFTLDKQLEYKLTNENLAEKRYTLHIKIITILFLDFAIQ